MNRICFSIVLVSIILPVSLHAEEYLSTIQALTAQVSDASVPVENKILEEIALSTYEVLVNIPFVGVQNSQTEIEGLIVLKRKLMAHTGVLERLLAIRMQEAIDRALFFETTRRAVHLMGTTVTPPYISNSLVPETVTALLEKNVIAEREQIQYIRNLHGKFAQFCRSKNFSVEDLLNGNAVRAFPPDLKTSMEKMQTVLDIMTWKMDKKTIEDVFFVFILATIDQAKDIRIVCDIYLYDSLPTSWETFRTQIDQRLALAPYIRVSNGLNSTANDVYTTADKYFGKREEDYPMMLTMLFLPYLSNTEPVITKINDVLFKYTGERGKFDPFHFPPGAWLELNE